MKALLDLFFIISNDKNALDKVLFNLRSFNEKDSKINLVTLRFSSSAYDKLKEKEEIKLLITFAQDLFHLLSEFPKFNKIKNEVKFILVDDELQRIDSDTFGRFQLYLNKNLFDLSSNSKIVGHEHLKKKKIETLLNEIFSFNKNES